MTRFLPPFSTFPAELHSSASLLSYSRLYVGGVGGLASSAGGGSGGGAASSDGGGGGGYAMNGMMMDSPGFVGSMQQLVVNGRKLFRLAASGQLSNHALNAVRREVVPVTL